MRSITYMLFILVSAFSLVMGFYDLYKNVPYLDEVSFVLQMVQIGRTYSSLLCLHRVSEHFSKGAGRVSNRGKEPFTLQVILIAM